MSDEAKRDLKNVMVLTLADGRLSEQERKFIERMRERVGLDEAEFRRLVGEVRVNPKKISLPTDPIARREALRVLVEAALADGEVSPAEQNLLQRIADHIGMPQSDLETMLSGQEVQVDEAEITARVDTIYAEFAGWDEPTRSARVTELGDMGTQGGAALLQLMESYRTPDGMSDALALKTLAAEQLGQVRDERAVYYLAQQMNIGDEDDETSNAALRAAAAEAIGRIVGEDFARDSSGVEQARQWWGSPGAEQYNRLAF